MMSRVEVEVRILFNEYLVAFEASQMEGSLDSSMGKESKDDAPVGNISMKMKFDVIEEF